MWGTKVRSHLGKLQTARGWLNAEQLILYHRMCLIHRVLAVEAPVGIVENLVASNHQHGTRTRGLLQRPSVKTDAGARRLFFSGIESYNKLPKAIRELEVTKFKTRVTDWLLRDAG